MNTIKYILSLIFVSVLTVLLLNGIVLAATVLTVPQGGTGSSTLPFGKVLIGAGNKITTASSTANTVLYSSGGIPSFQTNLSLGVLTLTGTSTMNGSNFCTAGNGACAAGGSQTPWTSDINGGGYSLSNVLNLTATNATTTTFRASGLATFGGNVGIGTTTPTVLLTLKTPTGSPVNTPALRIWDAAGGRYTDLYHYTGDDFNIFTSAGNIALNSATGAIANTNANENQGFRAYRFQGANSNSYMDFYRDSTNYGIRFYQGTDIATAGASIYLFDDKNTAGRLTAASGNQNWMSLEPTIAQSSTAGYTALNINTTQTSVGSGNNYLINAQVASDSKFAVLTSGNVGIGTTNPATKLEVSGGRLMLSNNQGITWRTVAGADAGSQIWYDTSNRLNFSGLGNDILFGNEVITPWNTSIVPLTINSANGQTADLVRVKSYGASAGDLLTVQSSGNVGIGTTTPNNLLTLTATTSPAIGFTLRTGGTGADGVSGWTMGVDTADANKFKIASSTAVGTNARLTIDGNGNVGIGTTTPNSLLTVNGNSAILNQNSLQLYGSGNTYYSAFAATSTLTQNDQYYLPANKGAEGQFLKNDGSGNLTWADPITQTARFITATNWTADVTGYVYMTPQPSTSTQVTLTNSALADGNTLLRSYITATNTPQFTTVPTGIWDWHFHALKSNSLKVVRLYAEFYKRSDTGVESPLLTTESSNPLTTAGENYTVHLATSTIQFTSTDRLVAKIYANVSGTGVAPDVTSYIMGSTVAGAELPLTLRAGVGLPEGGNKAVQYNDNGIFAGDQSFTFDSTGTKVTMTNASSTNMTATNLWGTGLTYTNGTITNASSTYGTVSTLWSNLATVPEFNFTNATGTRLSITNGTIANASTTYATLPTFWATTGDITTLTATNGTFTNATSTLSQFIPALAGLTLSAKGQIGIDTTTGNFNFRNANDTQVLTATSSMVFTISSTTASELISGKHFPSAATITEVMCNIIGGTSFVTNFRYDNDITASGLPLFSSDQTISTSTTLYASAMANNTPSARNVLWMTTSAITGVVRYSSCEVFYKLNP